MFFGRHLAVNIPLRSSTFARQLSTLANSSSTHSRSPSSQHTARKSSPPSHLTQFQAMPKPKRNINAVAEETLYPPTALEPGQQIARVKQAAGKNLYHVELSDGSPLLAELPSKFRSTIWMKRGSYVLVDTSVMADRDNKLGGEIVNLVGDEKAWRKMTWWPKEFVAKKSGWGDESEEDSGPGLPPSDSEDEV